MAENITTRTPAHKHEGTAAPSTCDAVAFHLSDPERKNISADWLIPRLQQMSLDQLDQLVRSLVYRKMRGGFRVPADNIELVKSVIAQVRS